MAVAPMAEALSMCSLSSCTSTEIRNNSGKHLHQLQLERLMAAGELSEATTRKVLRLCCAHFKELNSCGSAVTSSGTTPTRRIRISPWGTKPSRGPRRTSSWRIPWRTSARAASIQRS